MDATRGRQVVRLKPLLNALKNFVEDHQNERATRLKCPSGDVAGHLLTLPSMD
jgi:hypothetical protein